MSVARCGTMPCENVRIGVLLVSLRLMLARGSIKPRDIASAQVICTRGQRGIENVCGAEVTGILGTGSSQLVVKQKP
jgi:hypothetical protein